ncbi:MAG: LemA family protein [Candidatus Omnitrophica bacterium]|nr:LemA family protein [Candidatus Omnitrophota bacterium]
MSMVTDSIKRLFPSELGELKPVGRHWWQKIDFKNLQSREGVWAVVIAVVIILPGIYYYNKFINLSRFTDMEQHQIEVQLQRKRNLAANLARMVLAYAEHERILYKYMADSRTGNAGKSEMMVDVLKNIGIDDFSKMKPEAFKSSMTKLLAVAEAYPDLKLSTNFQDLMNALIISENRIADSRMEYNKAASIFHAAVKEVPGCIYAFVFGYRESMFHYAIVDNDLDKNTIIDYREPGLSNAGNREQVERQVTGLKSGPMGNVIANEVVK